MIILIDDEKHHLKCKTPTDGFHLGRHIRDDRIGLINHTVALTGCNILLSTEYEKHDDNTTFCLKKYYV